MSPSVLVQEKFEKLSGSMNERLRRHWAACEALALGRGGIAAVARAIGMSPNTVRRGIQEVQGEFPELAEEIERVRCPGGGRRALSETDSSLVADLQKLVDPATRGDPCSPLLWTSKSTRHLAKDLEKLGHPVSHMTVARLLKQLGYSLQANRKTKEGKEHPDRDGQFEFINKKVRAFQRRGQPVISVDTKKRELVGDFKNGGREWRPRGTPEHVRTHDFRDKELGVAIPYGVYDMTQNNGWVSVGIDRDTSEFAVASIRRWWCQMGSKAYPHAKSLLITADGGGSNSSRSRLWKRCIQELADALGLSISICHFPPGTSKWNKIEHRMFCHITENWRGKPLVSRAVIINLIGHTTTRKGLKIKAALDKRSYRKGIKVSDAEFATMNIKKESFHGDWNYTICPRPS